MRNCGYIVTDSVLSQLTKVSQYFLSFLIWHYCFKLKQAIFFLLL
jgi:hypothetical protein